MALKRKDNVGIVVDDLGGTIDFFRELGLELDLTELFSDALSEVAAPGTSFMERRKDSYRALRRASTTRFQRAIQMIRCRASSAVLLTCKAWLRAWDMPRKPPLETRQNCR